MQRLRSLDASFPELQLMHQGPRRSLKKGAGPECPTRNVFGVQTVLHRIPGLSERFVYVAPGRVFMLPGLLGHVYFLRFKGQIIVICIYYINIVQLYT